MKLTELLTLKFDGLSIKYAVGNRKEAIVIARGLGEPTREEDERWIEIFNQLGYTTLIPHYGGSWGSRHGNRKFLAASGDGALSAEKDITDVINALANGRIDIPLYKEISLIGNSFGAPIALISGAKSSYIQKIVSIGGGICSPHKAYDDRTLEMFSILDRDRNDLTQPWGRDGENYLGFDQEFARGFLGGKPISPYDYLNELATKDILLVHVRGDRHLLSQRSIDFSEEIKRYCNEKGIDIRVRLEIVSLIRNPELGRNTLANHGTLEATAGFYRKLFQFLDPEVDMERVAEVVKEVNPRYPALKGPVKKCYGLLELEQQNLH